MWIRKVSVDPPPRPLHLRKLRDISLDVRPPLLGEEGSRCRCNFSADLDDSVARSALLSSESQSAHTLVQVRPFNIQDPCGRRHIPICLFQNMQDAIALGILARFLKDVARIEIRFQTNFKGNGFNAQDIRGI